MITPVTTDLPPYVRELLEPAVQAVGAEVREAVAQAERLRLVREGELAVRKNGNSYRAGVVNILATVGAALGPTRERTCRCDSCEDGGCQGECDLCDDPNECPQHQCMGARSCCGYCYDCESHHGQTRDVTRVPCRRGSGHGSRAYDQHIYCRECDHVCDDM